MYVHIAIRSFRLDLQISWNMYFLFLRSFSVSYFFMSQRYFFCTWAASNGKFSYCYFDRKRDSENEMIWCIKFYIYWYIDILCICRWDRKITLIAFHLKIMELCTIVVSSFAVISISRFPTHAIKGNPIFASLVSILFRSV